MNRPLACLAVAAVAVVGLSARDQSQVREFTIQGNDHRFSPSRIEVRKDDVVKVTFTAADMPHSFTNERYRISNYGRYKLRPVAANRQWIRYGNDLVLVNTRNGRVILARDAQSAM